MQLSAFHNKVEEKESLLKQLQDHYDADEIIKGQYWEDGKGCAVGCTVHSNQHNCYEMQLGIPEWMARLEDTLFEGMPNEDAKEFPLRLIRAIPTGFSNWQHIYHQLCVHILEKECKNTDHPSVKQAICDIITLHKEESTNKEGWSAAESAATSAARSAARSARSAATSARSAATSAAESAWSAAWSAESAWSAAESAWSAAWSATSTAESAAESAAYKSMGDKLITLLEAEK